MSKESPKYEKEEKYIAPGGKSYTYNKALVSRVNTWLAANTDHFSMTLPVGIKQAMKACEGRALGKYMEELLERDMARRIDENEFTKEQLADMVAAYEKEIRARKKKYPGATFQDTSAMIEAAKKKLGE